MSKYIIKKLDEKLWALYDSENDCWLSSMTKDYNKLVALKEMHENEQNTSSQQLKLDI